MYFFNIAVGIERGFITRKEGAAHVKYYLISYMTEQSAHTHIGLMALMERRVPSRAPIIADLVEAYAEGLIFAREYFCH